MAQIIPRRIVHEEIMWNIGSVACASEVMELAEDVCIVSNVLAPYDNDTQKSTNFVGILKGASPVTNTAKVDVARVCIVDTNLVSATYLLGQAMAWSAKWKYAADGGSETICWFGSQELDNKTRGLCEINVFLLSAVASDNKLYETPAA